MCLHARCLRPVPWDDVLPLLWSPPLQYPLSDVYWNAIETVFSPGQFTPPLATFIYLFARKNYTTTTNGKIAKSFVQFAVRKAGGIAEKLGYTQVPNNLTALNLGAANAIVTAK